MRPFTIYPHVEGQQDKLVALIREVVQPTAIYLLGAALYRRRSESIFCTTAPTSQHISDFYLLVLIDNTHNRPLSEWRDQIEQHCCALLPVTLIVLETNSFTEWLRIGHRFAREVVQNAVPVYAVETDNLPLAQSIMYDATTERKAIERQYRSGLDKAREFLAGAELFRIRKQMKLSAFMLHQSAEQALHTLLITGTGFHYCTHNIDRLIRYAGMVSYQLHDVFPKKTDNDKRLFNLLQKAYIDSRYRQDYTIHLHDLVALTEKVKLIHDILEESGKSYVTLIGN